SVIEVRVPDIGDFKDVPIIEVAVKSGDQIKAEDPLITLESDKASMEVPSPSAGTVKDISVKIGDKVSAGSLILTLTTAPAAGPGAAARGARSSGGPAASADGGAPHRLRRRRMRHAGARRRSGRLFRRIPFCRPRHEYGAGGALSHAWRRVPQCRLHSVQGAFAYRRRHGRSEDDGGTRDCLFRAADRPRQAAQP